MRNQKKVTTWYRGHDKVRTRSTTGHMNLQKRFCKRKPGAKMEKDQKGLDLAIASSTVLRPPQMEKDQKVLVLPFAF